jgi:hypothetical protein
MVIRTGGIAITTDTATGVDAWWIALLAALQ